MLPQLEAEESLATVNQTVIGSGRADPHEARAVMHRWEDRASGGNREPLQQSSPERLKAVGVRVRRVPKKTPPAEP